MRSTSALLLSLALAPSPAFGQDRTASADPMASLVPSDAFFVVRVTSYDAFQEMATEIVSAFDPGEEGPDVAELMPADPDLFAKDKPMAMAASLRGGQPVMTMILPAFDPQAAVSALETEPGMAVPRTSGNYVGVCKGKSYEVGGSRMLDSMAAGQIAARLDLAPVFETFGPMIEMGMDQARMMAQSEMEDTEMPMDLDMEAMLDLYFDGFESFMDSAQIIDMGLELNAGMLSFTSAMSIAEGSPMSGFGSNVPVDFGPIVSRLGNQGLGTMLMGFDYADYDRIFGTMMGDVMSIYPESLRGAMESYMDGYAEILGACKPGFGTQFEMRNGMQMTMLAQAKEQAAAILPRAKEMMQSFDMDELGYSISPVEEVTIGEVSGFRSLFTVDVQTMMNSIGEETYEAADLEEMTRIMEVMYGGNSIPMWFGAMDKFLVGAMGNGSELPQQAVGAAQAANNRPDPMLGWAIGEVAGRTPSFVGHIDVVRLLRQIEPMVKSFDENADSLPENLPTSAPIAQYMLMENLSWSMGARMPLEAFAELARALD